VTVRRLILGSRGSALARRQSDIVLAALRGVAPDVDVEVQTVHTEGDRRQDVSLDAIGGQGVFVKDIEQRLQRREIDIAVHSLKDMPAETPAGLTIAALLPRADARDALVSRDNLRLAGLPAGAHIGTDSRRRSVQLTALRLDVFVDSIRGNVDTRIAKVMSGDCDAVVLAVAGLERLGRLDEASEVFEIDDMLPAPGQGVLAIECRADDAEVLDLLRSVDDAPTRAAATAERAFLRMLGAGCRLPVGAYAEVVEGRLRLRGLLASDFGEIAREETLGEVAEADGLGVTLAQRLMQKAGMTNPALGLEMGPKE
jgi:hydroxymethylbilane synthase